MPVRQIDAPSSKQVGDPIRLLLNSRFKRETGRTVPNVYRLDR
jgi:hypothetical protein